MKFKVGDKVKYTEKAAGYEGLQGEVIESWVRVRKYEDGHWPNACQSDAVIIKEDALLLEHRKDEILEI
jgi:hypothetical protein